MPRIPRDVLLYDGCYVHVISRSIRKARIIKDQEDFLIFLKLLKTAKNQSGFQLFHYCIMHTHFHLAVRVPDITLFSKAIQYIKSQYCFYYHAKYHNNGPIWRERFKSLLIEDKNYLRVCGEYIEYNPIKDGLVQQVEEWQFSSSQCYDVDKKDDLVDDYGAVGKPKKLHDICLEDDKYFEGGNAVGSPYFQYQIMERLKGA